MGRLIEVQRGQHCPSPLHLRPGDVLLLHAAGGRLRPGSEGVEILGPFLPAVVGDHGEVLTPAGTPNTVLLRALRPGHATIDLTTGDPWHSPGTTTLEMAVDLPAPEVGGATE
jgi:hypothetical protein